MAHQTVNTPCHQDERIERRILSQAVLRYLAMNGPTSWVKLYVHFDPAGTDGIGEIGRALEHLTKSKHIMIEGGGLATITTQGLEQLNYPQH